MIKVTDMIRRLKRRQLFCLFLAGALVIGYWCSLPSSIFAGSYSTVLTASNGQLLSASIADDGQWRFPQHDSIPDKFLQALITFEDKRFYYHPGVDPLSVMRAIVQNVKHHKIVSGGSTITMQVIRLSRKTKSRNIFTKGIEMILATRLELRYTKKEILAMYAAHAPFGGNVVGLDAACWRYFGVRARDLSWGESALLAVLPNSPSLIHPGKNRILLKKKRDKLLDRLFYRGTIDSLTWHLSKGEPIPGKPHDLPRIARHLMHRMKKDGLSQTILVSTIDYNLQRRVEQIMDDYRERLKANRIYNGAALILDVRTGHALAYVGNISDEQGATHGNEVDIIASPRSTGSVLKPFLFAAALDEGKILPKSLVPDIPVLLNGFAPKNFSKEYDGAVPASEALIRSLNVPSVLMLKEYRYEKFYSLLGNVGITTLKKPPDHYGLSLILGGAEGTLWDITGAYASMARTLNNYFTRPGKNRYLKDDFHGPLYRRQALAKGTALQPDSWISASSVYLTFDALKELYRPGEESGWKYFSSSKRIAWKTGTSFGFRDGWAIGVTPEYAVGVWIGNADGEGRPGLTGTNTAAPVLFDIFSLLKTKTWFNKPLSEMQQVITCRKSGHRASAYCDATDSVWINERGLDTPACSYHKNLYVSPDGKYQLHSACSDATERLEVNWFVLPPVQEYYYRAKNISYKTLPGFRPDCESPSSVESMDLVYPKANARLFIPRHFDGKPGSSIFQLAHRDDNAAVFWHLDGVYVGTTHGTHRLALTPPEGKHRITVVDEAGDSLEEHFTVISGL